MKKTIGILGGMGPEATAYFYELIIKNTKATSDQEHIPVVIFSNPKIPPRTDAVLNKGPNPFPFLKEGVKILQKAGADFFVLPCITAHYFSNELAEKAQIPFLSLLDESFRYSKKYFSSIKKAGLIASTGTIQSQIFHQTFARGSIQILTPFKNEQEQVMDAIFGKKGIKAGFTSGHPHETIHTVAAKLIERGAEAIIAGCTEVPLVLKDKDIPVPLIEPLRIAALACIKKAGYEIKE